MALQATGIRQMEDEEAEKRAIEQVSAYARDTPYVIRPGYAVCQMPQIHLLWHHPTIRRYALCCTPPLRPIPYAPDTPYLSRSAREQGGDVIEAADPDMDQDEWGGVSAILIYPK
eukprot:3940422-Rhodomonas_salina.1